MALDNKIKTKILQIGKNYAGVKKIVLFGSRARGDNKESSDIDLGIFTFGKSFDKKFSFVEDIENIETLFKWDIVFINDKTNKALLEIINSEGVTLMERLSKKENYKNAVVKLLEAIKKASGSNDDLIMDGLIQRFEFTTELAWKACREWLIDIGHVDINGPKPVMKEAFANGLISDGDLWLQIINDRNLTSHIYDEETSREICERIIKIYADEFEKLDVALNK